MLPTTFCAILMRHYPTVYLNGYIDSRHKAHIIFAIFGFFNGKQL